MWLGISPNLFKGERHMARSVKVGEEWTIGEVRALRKIFGNTSNRRVATALDRTPKAVERKASKLGLAKTKKYLRTLGK